MSEKTFSCPKCDEIKNYNFCVTRRPNKSENSSKICDACGQREAFVDMSDNIVETGLLHHEYSYFQLCCGDTDKTGDERFQEFLEFRKEIGKHDPTPKEIDAIILKKMVASFS